jgi:hypothetical protein
VPVVVSEEQEEEIEKEMAIEKEKVKVRWINLHRMLLYN